MAFDEAYTVLKSDIQEIVKDLEVDVNYLISQATVTVDDDELRTITGKLHASNNIMNKLKGVLDSHEY